MTYTTDTTPTPGSAPVPPRRPRRRGLVAGLAVSVIAFAFALARADGGADLQASATQQIAAGRQACQQWLDDGTASALGREPAGATKWPAG